MIDLPVLTDFPFGSNLASSTSLTTVTGCFGVLAVETFADFCDGDRAAAAGDFCGVKAGDFWGVKAGDFWGESDFSSGDDFSGDGDFSRVEEGPGVIEVDNPTGDLDGDGSGDISGVFRIRFSSNCCFI